MAKPPSRTTVDNAVIEAHLRAKRIDSFTVIVRDSIKWGGLAVLGYWMYKSVVVLAGQTTYADIGFRILGNIKVSDGILYLFGVSGWVFGIGQSQLRRKNIKRTVPAKNALERIIDPNRTSSNLTDSGTTQPGDEI
jgi:hypothetical protein